MLVVRGTKKLLDRVGGVTPRVEPATTALGDWYATALFWRPQVALFVNAPTRLPVFVALAPAASLVERFASELQAVFSRLELDARFIESELGEMRDHRFDKTTDRSVIGSMNDFGHLANADRRLGRIADLRTLSFRLARTPCGPLQSGNGFPDRALRALVDRAVVAQPPGTPRWSSQGDTSPSAPD